MHRHPPPFERRPVAGPPRLVRIAEHDVVGRARLAIGTDGKQAKFVACGCGCINEWLAPVVAQSRWGHTLRPMAACTVPATDKVVQLDRQLPTTGMECLDRGLQPRQMGFHDQLGAPRAVDRAAGRTDHEQAEHGEKESGPAPEILIRPCRRPCHWLLARSRTPPAHTSHAVHYRTQRADEARQSGGKPQQSYPMRSGHGDVRSCCRLAFRHARASCRRREAARRANVGVSSETKGCGTTPPRRKASAAARQSQTGACAGEFRVAGTGYFAGAARKSTAACSIARVPTSSDFSSRKNRGE